MPLDAVTGVDERMLDTIEERARGCLQAGHVHVELRVRTLLELVREIRWRRKAS